MEDLAILLRALQLLAHINHNLVKGTTFFSDHEFLGELYAAYETAYDSVVERIIGTSGMKPQALMSIQESAVKVLKQATVTGEPEMAFKTLVQGEAELQKICESIKGSAGTLNLVAQLADDSEVRSYKLQQRLK
jgi:DNA-binding ferritin-like protein